MAEKFKVLETFRAADTEFRKGSVYEVQEGDEEAVKRVAQWIKDGKVEPVEDDEEHDEADEDNGDDDDDDEGTAA